MNLVIVQCVLAIGDGWGCSGYASRSFIPNMELCSTMIKSKNPSADFEQSAELVEPGLVREFWEFLQFNKKWWLTPIVIVLLLVGFLIFMSGTAAAPIMYTIW